MAIEFVRMRDRSADIVRFQQTERLQIYLIGIAVLFASLGLGEAVYRLAFSDYDGATDRLPIEAFFGLVFAALAIKLARSAYRHRKQTTSKLDLIWHRNHRIRHALEGISPMAHPARTQQSIRVIREEVDQIEGAIKDVLPR